MRSVLDSLLLTLRTSFRARLTLQLEILALRHQLQVLERSRSQRIRLPRADRLLWVWISRVWDGWRHAIMIVKPETVVAWLRPSFRLFWTWKSRRRVGRPGVPPDVRQLIREAFPEDEVPRYLIRDRDAAFAGIGPTATGMGIHEVLTAPRSPWQNAYAERVIGSIRHECLNHVIVVNEIGLSRIGDARLGPATRATGQDSNRPDA